MPDSRIVSRPAAEAVGERTNGTIQSLGFSTYEELDVKNVKKAPQFHGAEAPGKPLAAAFNFLAPTLPPLRCCTVKASNEPTRISPQMEVVAGAIRFY